MYEYRCIWNNIFTIYYYFDNLKLIKILSISILKN